MRKINISAGVSPGSKTDFVCILSKSSRIAFIVMLSEIKMSSFWFKSIQKKLFQFLSRILFARKKIDIEKLMDMDMNN